MLLIIEEDLEVEVRHVLGPESREHGTGHSEALEDLAIQMPARRLSARDYESKLPGAVACFNGRLRSLNRPRQATRSRTTGRRARPTSSCVYSSRNAVKWQLTDGNWIRIVGAIWPPKPTPKGVSDNQNAGRSRT